MNSCPTGQAQNRWNPVKFGRDLENMRFPLPLIEQNFYFVQLTVSLQKPPLCRVSVFTTEQLSSDATQNRRKPIGHELGSKK